MTEFYEEGGIHVSPGPRGFSVTGVETSPDGTQAYFLTDQPGKLNGITLPRGPRGEPGEYGDPGEAHMRIDNSVGHRVYMWDGREAVEAMIHGDTGVRDIDGVKVHRSMGQVTTDATDPSTLPEGFRPSIAGAKGTYLTAEPWPSALPGTEVTPPVQYRGLEGHAAATANGFVGTVEDYLEFVYRSVLPPGGNPGDVVTMTNGGPRYLAPPNMNPTPWVNITLGSNWKTRLSQTPQIRLKHGRTSVALIGAVTYTGASMTAGVWGEGFVHVGNIPPGYAPEAHLDLSTVVFKGDPGVGTMNYPLPGRINITTDGRIMLGAFQGPNGELALPLEANETQLLFNGISYELRNSAPA